MQQNSRRDFLGIASITAAMQLSPSFDFATGRGWAGASQSIRQDDLVNFFEACSNGDLVTIRRLIDAEPKLIQAVDALNRSGFAVALLNRHLEVSEFLKLSGYMADLHESVLAQDWERYDAVVAAKGDEAAEVANSDHPIGGTAMFAAAAAGAGADTWRVYAVGGNPDQSPREARGVTPLQAALRFAELPVAEVTAASMLSNNTNPNPVANADSSPLHIAAERGSLELVEMLIRLGADVNAIDSRNRTSADLAEQSGHQNVRQLIVDHDQIPRTCRTSRTAYDSEGQPYHAPDISDLRLQDRLRMVGQSHGNLEHVEQAVRAEPRLVHSVATTSEICIEACAHIGRKPIVDFLLMHGAPYSLPTAVMMGDVDTVKRLLKEDPNRIHERGAHDFGLLWYPIIGQCDLEMLQLLLNGGAKVEQQHYLGTTALHWACMRGTAPQVELLIESGADVNRVGRKFKADGETPMEIARSGKNEEIIKLLLASGAK